MRFGLGIGAALVERLRDGGRQIILLLLHHLLVSIGLLARAGVVVRPACSSAR